MSLCKLNGKKAYRRDKSIEAARLEARATREKIQFIVSDALH
jgi:hypothetical protein